MSECKHSTCSAAEAWYFAVILYAVLLGLLAQQRTRIDTLENRVHALEQPR